jgi:hypothetical protein
MARTLLFHAPGAAGLTACGKPTVRVAAPGSHVSCASCRRALVAAPTPRKLSDLKPGDLL